MHLVLQSTIDFQYNQKPWIVRSEEQYHGRRFQVISIIFQSDLLSIVLRYNLYENHIAIWKTFDQKMDTLGPKKAFPIFYSNLKGY